MLRVFALYVLYRRLTPPNVKPDADFYKKMWKVLPSVLPFVRLLCHLQPFSSFSSSPSIFIAFAGSFFSTITAAATASIHTTAFFLSMVVTADATTNIYHPYVLLQLQTPSGDTQGSRGHFVRKGDPTTTSFFTSLLDFSFVPF
jgi:hypothetical protein